MMDGYPYCIELSAQAQAALETSETLSFIGSVFAKEALFVALFAFIYLIIKRSRFAKERDSSSRLWLLPFVILWLGGGALWLIPFVYRAGNALFYLYGGAILATYISGVYCLWRFKGETLKKVMIVLVLALFGCSMLAYFFADKTWRTVYDGVGLEYALRPSDVRYQPGACAQWKTGPDLQVVLPKA